VGCGWVRHRIRAIVEAGEEHGIVVVDVVRVCRRVVGSVAAASGLGVERIGAVLLGVEGNAVAAAVAQEERKEAVGRIDLPVEAQRIAADLEALGLSCVSSGISRCGVGWMMLIESTYHIHLFLAVLLLISSYSQNPSPCDSRG
jgi:hypothetical protein